MAGSIIATREATVKTLSVEIKSLTVSGKQMTMGLFRQLADGNILDPVSLQLRGVPWGQVNYFWGDCKPNHLHVIWQEGDGLRRSCVWPDGSAYWMHEEAARLRAATALRHLLLYYTLVLLHAGLPLGEIKFEKPGDQRSDITIGFRGCDFVSCLNHADRRSFSYCVDGGRPELVKNALDAFAKKCETSECWPLQADRHNPGEIHDRLVSTHNIFLGLQHRLDDRKRLYGQRYTELLALDQLFIAV